MFKLMKYLYIHIYTYICTHTYINIHNIISSSRKGMFISSLICHIYTHQSHKTLLHMYTPTHKHTYIPTHTITHTASNAAQLNIKKVITTEKY